MIAVKNQSANDNDKADDDNGEWNHNGWRNAERSMSQNAKPTADVELMVELIATTKQTWN